MAHIGCKDDNCRQQTSDNCTRQIEDIANEPDDHKGDTDTFAGLEGVVFIKLWCIDDQPSSELVAQDVDSEMSACTSRKLTPSQAVGDRLDG